MNKQREDMLWDTLDLQAKVNLSKKDYQTYLNYKKENDRDLCIGFIWDCIESYEEYK